MADSVGTKVQSGSVGTTAETVSFTHQVLQIRVTNYHATQVLWARVNIAGTAAAALAAAVATVAVAAADDNYIIPAGKTAVLYKSVRPEFVALSVIGSGAATTYTAEGTNFFG